MVGKVQEGVLYVQAGAQSMGCGGGQGVVHNRLGPVKRQRVEAGGPTAGCRGTIQQPQTHVGAQAQESRASGGHHRVHRIGLGMVWKVWTAGRCASVHIANHQHRLISARDSLQYLP